MMTTVRIAFRNTRRQKKRSFLLGGAIAFGVMMITLLNAFTAGVVDNVKINFSYIIGGHIFITGTELTSSGRVINSIGDDDIAQTALEEVRSYVRQINRRSQTMGQLVFGSKDAMQRIDGIDWDAEPDLVKNLTVVEGSLTDLSDPQALILPRATAGKLGVAVGETLLVKLSTATGQQNLGEFRLIAITKDQTGFGIDSAYASLPYLNELLGLEKEAYQMLHVFLKDMTEMDAAADIVYESIAAKAEVKPRFSLEQLHADQADNEEAQAEALGQMFGGEQRPTEPWSGTKFAVTTLNDIMAPVMSLVGVLNTIGLVVFLILLVITMVGIMNTFRMVLIERTQEIGTMRAIGMQQGAVRNIFMMEALFIGVGGALAGLVIASVVMLLLSLIRFTSSSALQFFLSHNRLTFRLVPSSVLLNFVLLMGMTVLAAYVPARAAARLKPADALRTTY
jgi:putative ABC transport system permease protein